MKTIDAVNFSQAVECNQLAVTDDAARYELCFRPLFGAGCAFAFPCDVSGNVDLDHLSECALKNYLYARVVTGSQFAWPSIERRA